MVCSESTAMSSTSSNSVFNSTRPNTLPAAAPVSQRCRWHFSQPDSKNKVRPRSTSSSQLSAVSS